MPDVTAPPAVPATLPAALPAAPPAAPPVTTPPVAAPPVTPPVPPTTELTKGQPPTEPKGDQGLPADFVIKVPDGVRADPDVMKSFVEFARTNKVSAEATQKYADQYFADVRKSAQAEADRQLQQTTTWAEESKKAIPDFEATLKLGQRALQKLGSPELSKILNETGLGNHKEVISFFAKVGKFVAEDRLPGGEGSEGAADVAPETLLYPSMQPKK
jgi:hypothetical protein